MYDNIKGIASWTYLKLLVAGVRTYRNYDETNILQTRNSFTEGEKPGLSYQQHCDYLVNSGNCDIYIFLFSHPKLKQTLKLWSLGKI